MSRAVLMQCPGDPFLTDYWLRNYERVWKDVVDELHVFVNGQTDPRILEFLDRRVRGLGGIFTCQPGRLVHGQATRRLVQECSAEHVLLIEDDAFVRDASEINWAFNRIEGGEADVLATPRGGMSPDIEQAALAKWGDPPVSPEGNSGYGLWPCFVFAPMAVLHRTDHRYESWSWNEGDVVPGLDYRVGPGGSHTDSFTAIAFQLYGMELEVEPCVQYKELWNRDLPETGAPWFHAGGLSNAQFTQGLQFFGGHRPDVGGTNEGLDWAHRIWWWRNALDTSNAFPEKRNDYRIALYQLVAYLGVQRELEEWEPRCLPWINWDDRA